MRSTPTTKLLGLVCLTLVTPVVVGCSIFGGTVLDAGKTEAEIAKYLDGRYAEAGVKVDSVACDGAPEKPKPGDKFTCDANVRGVTVPVEVTVKDEDMRIEFVETKKLYDLPKVGPSILTEVQKQIGQAVTVDCGKGFKAAGPGESFPCQIANKADATDTLTIDYKVGPMDGADRWEPRKESS